jgi:hypothetical protein
MSQSIIGTAPNQVPTNGDLGSMAFQDAVSVVVETASVATFARFVPLAAAPASPVAGMVYFDSSTSKLKCHDGTNWQDLF